MNKAKQIVRVEQKGPKKMVDPEERKKKLTIIGISVAAILFICMCVVIFWEAFHKDPVVTVDGEKYYASDVEVMYNVYMAEAAAESVAKQWVSMYGLSGSDVYWNMGSVKNKAKEDALTNIINYELMYREAEKNGVSLTEEEKTETTDKYTKVFENMNSKRVNRTGFEKDSFVEYALKATLAEKYMDQLKEGYGITKDNLETPVNKEDYDERKVETIYVPISTSDSEDNAIPLSDEEKAEYKAKMEEYLKEAQDGKEFKDILPEGEEKFVYREELSFVTDTTQLPEELVAASKDLKDGEIYNGVIEATNYYFIVKMIDNDPDTAYQQAVETQVETERQAKLDDYINTLKDEYKVSQGKGWDEVNMGETAVLIGEDISELSASTSEEAEATASPSAEATVSPSPEATTESK